MKLFQKLFGRFTSPKAEAPKAELPAAKETTKKTALKACRPVDQYLKDGTWVQTFPSVRSAAAAVGVHYSKISTCCSGKQKLAGGYKWRYADRERC
jgi:hypothetical protein